MYVLSCSNQKGGVGKTTTTICLAVAAADQGMNVLVIDIDPQGNLTDAIATPEFFPKEGKMGISEVIRPGSDIKMQDVIVSTQFERVSLVPSTDNDSLTDTEALIQAEKLGGPARLKRALGKLNSGQYDLVIIDCPTASNNLTLNALTAANAALVVTQPEQFSMAGITKVVKDIRRVQEHVNNDLEIAGFLVNMYVKNEVEARVCVDELKQLSEYYEIPLLEPYIPRRADIAKSAKQGLKLSNHKDEALRNVAASYERLLKTIMKGL